MPVFPQTALKLKLKLHCDCQLAVYFRQISDECFVFPVNESLSIFVRQHTTDDPPLSY